MFIIIIIIFEYLSFIYCSTNNIVISCCCFKYLEKHQKYVFALFMLLFLQYMAVMLY